MQILTALLMRTLRRRVRSQSIAMPPGTGPSLALTNPSISPPGATVSGRCGLSNWAGIFHGVEMLALRTYLIR
jgi:hypothetical protein